MKYHHALLRGVKMNQPKSYTTDLAMNIALNVRGVKFEALGSQTKLKR